MKRFFLKRKPITHHKPPEGNKNFLMTQTTPLSITQTPMGQQTMLIRLLSLKQFDQGISEKPT
jgi:hypothetical protein